MLYTGLRYCDLQYLEPCCVEIHGNRLRIDVTQTKAIRDEILRTELVIPSRLAPPAPFDAFVNSARKWIIEARTPTLAPKGQRHPL